MNTLNDYAVIGNCTTAALIGADASIDWLCLPFFDSASVFARILDQDRGGFFQISAENLVRITQQYLPHTAILKTTFETEDGTFELRDYMPRFLLKTGDMHCPSEIHRTIIVVKGAPRMVVRLAPRPNYGSSSAQMKQFPDYIKITAEGGEYTSYYLYTDFPFDRVIAGQPIELGAGGYFLLSYHEKIEAVNARRIFLEYEKTKSHWLDWIFQTPLPEKYRNLTERSMITLKLLMYQRTGAVVAAPTTSLPEIIGGARNWDYRYCWMRDASMMIDLYLRLKHFHSASRFVRFILDRMLLKEDNIAVVYGINGEKELPERELPHLAGYAGSRPVRVGNDAYRQVQNDVYGELIEMFYMYFVAAHQHQETIDEEIWTLVRTLVNHVEATYDQPDHGIWEQRGRPRHYVHSKVMAWVACDRAAKIALSIRRPQHAKRYRELADKMKTDICQRGYDTARQSFVMDYGSTQLDASSLLMLHYGFLPPQDPRIISTVKAIEAELVTGGFVRRYTKDEQFGDSPNAFVLCIFWMVNALYLIGEEAKAREMFEHTIKHVNRHGLLSEDIETATGRLTGNFPQGYSHLALVQSVLLLETNYDWSDVSLLRA